MKNMLTIRKYKDAAIRAGYSPKGAKQQGYRVLKWIGNENTRRRNNGEPMLWGY
jgi:phage terminase small subunit